MIYQTEATREKILRIAQALFLERGFFRTQMKDVADAVGISRNTLYRYFRDKGDLGFAILDIVIGRAAVGFRDALNQAEVEGHPNAREKLMAVMSKLVLGGQHDTDMIFMAEFDAYYSGERLPKDFSGRQDLSIWTPVGEALESLAREGAADGSIRQDIDPPLLLWLVLSAIRLMRREILTRPVALALPRDVDTDRLLPALITLLADGLKPQD